MKKNILLLFLFFCLSAGTAMGQNNGFMGRRFLVNADIVVSPSYLNHNFWGGQGYLAFNYIFSPNIEIIAWKKGTVGITGHVFNSQYFHNYYEQTGGYYWEGYGASEYVPFNVFGYGLYYKQYFYNARAPMGPYVKFQFDFFHSQYLEKPEGEYAFVPAAKFEMGNDYLFFNRLRLSFGVSLGITFKGMGAAIDKKGYHSHEESSMGRVGSIYWLGFKMGIGILTF